MSTMNLIKDGKIFHSRGYKLLARALILYIFSEIFKSFDMTFAQSVRAMPGRSLLFSALYILYGLVSWAGASWLAGRVEHSFHKRNTSVKLVMLAIVLVLYGILVSFIFGFCYGVTDILLFHRYEAWMSFLEISYDMNFGTFLFYVMLLAFNGIIFYYKAWKEYQLQAERLMRENIQAKYDALRNQIDPHFFFNSLSVLTNLVYKSADLSADYITQLAKIYRYILDRKLENLVPIQAELDFLDSYIFLMHIRHQNSIQLINELDEKTKLSGMIPPASLQMLVENAIKHNRFSVAEPLVITMKNDNGCLQVSNELRKKAVPETSGGIGLENIRKRYELVSGQDIAVSQEDGKFTVSIPIITYS